MFGFTTMQLVTIVLLFMALHFVIQMFVSLKQAALRGYRAHVASPIAGIENEIPAQPRRQQEKAKSENETGVQARREQEKPKNVHAVTESPTHESNTDLEDDYTPSQTYRMKLGVQGNVNAWLNRHPKNQFDKFVELDQDEMDDFYGEVCSASTGECICCFPEIHD